MLLWMRLTWLMLCIYMLSVEIVAGSVLMVLWAALVLVLGRAVCKQTNWMDEEGDEA